MSTEHGQTAQRVPREAAAAPGPMVPDVYRIGRRHRETADTWTIELEPADGSRPPSFEPGQFNMVYAFGIGEVPISISGDPASSGPLVHTVRAVGAVTEAICGSHSGASLGVRGPYGSSWPVSEAEGGDLVVIAGGLGLAPLRPALLAGLASRSSFHRVVLLYGGREPEQLLFRHELERWREDPAVEMAVTVDTAGGGWSGDVGVVTKLIDRAGLDPARSLALLCGPEAMMRFAIRSLRGIGLAAEDMLFSIERNMKCALTQCGRCQFGPTFACREGAVLRLSHVEPFYDLREV